MSAHSSKSLITAQIALMQTFQNAFLVCVHSSGWLWTAQESHTTMISKRCFNSLCKRKVEVSESPKENRQFYFLFIFPLTIIEWLGLEGTLLCSSKAASLQPHILHNASTDTLVSSGNSHSGNFHSIPAKSIAVHIVLTPLPREQCPNQPNSQSLSHIQKIQHWGQIFEITGIPPQGENY